MVGDDKRQQDECRIIEPPPVFLENSFKREKRLGKSKSEGMKKRNQKLYLTPQYNSLANLNVCYYPVYFIL